MAIYDKANIWDCEDAQIFVGAGDGSDTGFNAVVTIRREVAYHEVMSAPTGAQPLDKRIISDKHFMEIEFQELADIAHFEEYWVDQRTQVTGQSNLHAGTIGGSAVTRQVRAHPRSAGATLTHDFVFTHATLVSPLSLTLDGKSAVTNKVVLEAMPDPTQLPTLDPGTLGHVSA